METNWKYRSVKPCAGETHRLMRTRSESDGENRWECSCFSKLRRIRDWDKFSLCSRGNRVKPRCHGMAFKTACHLSGHFTCQLMQPAPEGMDEVRWLCCQSNKKMWLTLWNGGSLVALKTRLDFGTEPIWNWCGNVVARACSGLWQLPNQSRLIDFSEGFFFF